MNISILGCGWLGLPLAEHLIERGHRVKGSTTTEQKLPKLKNRSISPFLLHLDPHLSTESNISDFCNSDVLVLNIPPGRGRKNIIEYHSKQIQSLLQPLSDSSICHVVFISSTSVYPARCGEVSETDAIPGQASRDTGEALLQAEQLLLEAPDFEATVLRFGGLIGGDRHPVKYLGGRKNLPKASAPVNLIHREDCIQIITQIIEEHITDEIFNAVADEHPSRQAYYTKVAKSKGLKPPTFKADDQKNYKIVSNEKLKDRLDYAFLYSLNLQH